MNSPTEESTRPTVLVVDDDQEILDALQQVLGDAGYDVVGARNGSEALDRLRSISPSPSAILLDLFMPVMNGWEFVREVGKSERTAHVPIIVVTAAGSHWGFPLPPTRVMHKPIHRDNLLRLLRQVLRD